MKIATAFSGGFGSVEFAFKYLKQDHEIIFACEWKDPQRKSYINNHGEPKDFYKDIRDMNGTKHKGEIDYYHLSPPCQSYSFAGSRGGAADERGGLMFEAIKSIDQVQPKMFSVENVHGLLSSNEGEDWKNIIRDFKSLKGYTTSWGIINAKEQGTPQNRQRVFIVGFRGQAPHMSFPKRVNLDKNIGSILEDEVNKKYYLKNSTIESIKRIVAKEKGYSRLITKDTSYAKTLTVRMNKSYNADYLICEDKRIRRLTPREYARLQGDFKDMFKCDGFIATTLDEFIGNAMDISSTKNLITKMLKHCEIVKFTEPLNPSFKSIDIVQKSLF